VSRYYYFAATLPALQLGAPAPMGTAEFLERCSRHLASADYAVVEAALLGSAPEGPPAVTERSPLLTRYHAWERSLRNELVRLRARRLERDGEGWLRPAARDDAAPRVAQMVFQAASPLEAELLLERQRWEAIESFKALHFFDLESIVAYRLELQILARLARLRQEEGEARYRETYAAILGAARTSESGVTQ
jgi:hypothetical protein